MSAPCDVVVVGAGIVGAACALACAREGMRVTVLERDVAPGLGATATGMGQLVVMDGSDAELALTRYSVDLWHELAERLPPDCEYDRCGTVWVACNEAEYDAAVRKSAYYREHGVEAELLDARALYAYEPNLRPGLKGGLRVPGDAILYAPRATAAMLAEAQSLGTRVLYGRRTTALIDGGVELHDGAVVHAAHVVVATGVHARELLPELPVRPRKGHLVITERYPAFVRHEVVELGYLDSAHGTEQDSVAFNVQPRPTGQLLIGSSRQFDIADSEIDAAMVGRMVERALAYLPGLAGLDVLRVWAGHRAATPDGLPYIGPNPTRPGVICATGHEGLGITTALGTASLIADMLAGRTPAIAAEPYLPARVYEEPAHA